MQMSYVKISDIRVEVFRRRALRGAGITTRTNVGVGILKSIFL